MGVTNDQLAVMQHDHNLNGLAIAGAGSGKSFSLEGFITNAINNGAAPHKIIVMMFGRAAADGFELRLKKKIGEGRPIPRVETFHSLSSLVIKVLVSKQLMESAEFDRFGNKQRKLLAEVLRANGVKESFWGTIEKLITFIDYKKSTLKPSLDVIKELKIDSIYVVYFDKWFKEFEERRKKARLRFNADLIYDLVDTLNNSEYARNIAKNLYELVVIDEYQDISEVQQSLVRYLVGERTKVFAVGDDDQCIFKWRGASPEYIISKFHQDFPNPKTYFLSQTFRYGSQLALAAHNVISNNTDRVDKVSVSSGFAFDTQITLTISNDIKTNLIKAVNDWLSHEGRRLNEIAILVRAYSHAAYSELVLLQNGIPYRVEGETSLLMRPDVSGFIAAMALKSGAIDLVSESVKVRLLESFLKFPSMYIANSSLFELINKVREQPENIVGYLSELIPMAITQDGKNRLIKKLAIYRSLANSSDLSVEQLVETVAKTSDIANEILLGNGSQEAVETWLEIQNAIEQFGIVGGYSGLDFCLALIDMTTGLGKSNADDDNKITITSVHRTKGLEYPCVIMPELRDGNFPLVRRGQAQTLEWLEDERRLFYVAMTRAIEHLVMLSHFDPQLEEYIQNGDDPESRPLTGSIASRFVYEANIPLARSIGAILAGDLTMLNKSKSKKKTIDYLRKMQQQGLISG